MADKGFNQLVDTIRRQRYDLERQMEDTDASQTRTTDLMKAIEDLRERVERTSSSKSRQGE